MSNSAHHLLLTGTDLADARPTVERLLGLNHAPERTTVELQIATDSHSAQQYFALTPIAQVQFECLLPPEDARLIESMLVTDDRPRDGVPTAEGVYLWATSTDSKALDCLKRLAPAPVSVHIDQLAPRDFDWNLVARLDAAERAVVHWTDCWWAPVPEAGLPGDPKHAGVVMSINSVGLWDLKAASAGFRLYVEVREGMDDLARWIGEQVRRPVVAPPEYY